MGLLILMYIIFSVSHIQLLHNKMMKNDIDYKINVMDERNISIKEKSGNITNMITMVLLGLSLIHILGGGCTQLLKLMSWINCAPR